MLQCSSDTDFKSIFMSFLFEIRFDYFADYMQATSWKFIETLNLKSLIILCEDILTKRFFSVKIKPVIFEE